MRFCVKQSAYLFGNIVKVDAGICFLQATHNNKSDMGVFGNRKSIRIKDYKNARDIALFVLFEICENRRKSNTILRESFLEAEHNGAALSGTDRAFIERLVIGSLDRLITLDAILARFLAKPMKSQKPLVKAVLRLGLYQLLYMDKVPYNAAVNESVNLIKLHGMEGMAGLINGVLRSVIREKEAGGAKLDTENETSVRYSLPKWMCRLLTDEYGSETAKRIFNAYLAERKETVRFNISKVYEDLNAIGLQPSDKDAELYIAESLAKDGFNAVPIDMEALLASDNSVYKDKPSGAFPVIYEISGGGDISRTEAFTKGYITVQDPASALVASFANAAEREYCIDVCAAPGGKSLAIAELSKDRCRIEARDVSVQKVALITENVARCRYNNINVRVLDALSDDEDSLFRADVLIADLPCSGLGVIAKKPDIKLNLEGYAIEELQALQRDILSNVSRFVKPKGRLVYSTCTLSRRENEDNTAYIESELGFKKISECKLLPGEHNDGFYIAVFKKHY